MTWGEESWWFPYSTHSMNSAFWIPTPQSSKILGRSWVSHGCSAIQCTEVFSRGPAPSPLKSNIMYKCGMLLWGWQAWVPSYRQAFLQGTNHTWTCTLLTWNWVVPTESSSRGWEALPWPGTGATWPPPPEMVWLLRSVCRRPCHMADPRAAWGEERPRLSWEELKE